MAFSSAPVHLTSRLYWEGTGEEPRYAIENL